jgi:CheY-like chemotaxis protein
MSQVSVVESNQPDIKIVEFPLREVIGALMVDRPESTGTSSHRLSISSATPLPDRIVSDPDRLRLVLEWLARDAAQAAGPAEICLSISASPAENSLSSLFFEFRTSPLALETRLSADQTLSPPAVSEESELLVRTLDGEVGLRRTPFSQVLVWCRIPVRLPVSETPLLGRLARSWNALSQGGEVRILMAEDNLINQRVGKLILQRAGYQIDLVADGSEAVEAHRSQPYQLILMDCQMPTMDGFEATRQIRSLDVQQPRVIAVTANALVGERERCLAAGMDDYLSKPFQAEQLVSMVRKWVEAPMHATSQPALAFDDQQQNK